MRVLEDRIKKEGKLIEGKILLVDSFLNHQMDPFLFLEMGLELKRRFAEEKITKILTIESSGIGISCVAALVFGVPVVSAKKNKAKNLRDCYVTQVASYTRGGVYDIFVCKDYITPDDNVLIIDDFLAEGNALIGLANIVNQAGATLAGAGIAIEKGFQAGGGRVRDLGIRVEALALIESMDENGIIFK